MSVGLARHPAVLLQRSILLQSLFLPKARFGIFAENVDKMYNIRNYSTYIGLYFHKCIQ